MLDDSDRLLTTIEQVLRTGRVGSTAHQLNRTRIDLDEVVRASRGAGADAAQGLGGGAVLTSRADRRR